MTSTTRKAWSLPRAINLPAIATAIGLLALWEAWMRLSGAQFAFLPAPTQIVEALFGAILSGDIIADATHTTTSALIGWAIASLIGTAMGLAFAFSRVVNGFFNASLELLRPLPAVAFVPVAVLLFGFSIHTEILVISYACIWPVLINTTAGAKAIHPRLFDTAATLQLRWTQRLTSIIVPAVLPSSLVGMRLSLGLALVIAVIVEMVGNPAGLGWGLVEAQQALQPELMFAYLVATGVLGVILNASLGGIVAQLFPGIREVR